MRAAAREWRGLQRSEAQCCAIESSERCESQAKRRPPALPSATCWLRCHPATARPARPAALSADGAVASPKRPFAAIVGGSKVSTKIAVIESLLEKCDKLILG